MRRKEASRLGRRPTYRRRWIVLACLVAAAGLAFVLAYWLHQRPSADEQLRAIDAAHAVPEEQNAARDYMLLVLNGTGAFLDPQLLAQKVQAATLTQTWRRAPSQAGEEKTSMCSVFVIPTKAGGRAEWVPKRIISRLGSQVSGREWAYHPIQGQMSRLRFAPPGMTNGVPGAGLVLASTCAI